MRDYCVFTCLLCMSVCLAAVAQTPGVFDVRAFGATGDGVVLDTPALQATIDACNEGGGGTVVVPAGRYLTGTLTLKNGVTIELSKGAVLAGSTKLEHYPRHKAGFASYTDNYTVCSLIYAENARDIAVRGEGAIDGQGAAFSGEYKQRPYLLHFVTCEGVTLDGITLRDGAMWTVHVLACNRVAIQDVTIRSRCNKNNDGLDIDSSSNVRVSDCDISSGDDAIVFKSTSARPCVNATVSNCVLSSACNALKMGTESNGGFQNIAIANCAIYDTRLSGIALEVVDGGVMDGIAISNIAMCDVGGPIFIRLGDRGRPYQDGLDRPGVGRLRNVSISHVLATGADITGCSITGLPEHPVEGIALSDIRIEFAGGGTAEDAARVPDELPDKYPEYKMFGKLPAYGFFIRHADDVRLLDVSVTTQASDARPPLVNADCRRLELVRFSPPIEPAAK